MPGHPILIDPAAPLPVPRAPIQYYGGKGQLAAKLIPLIPAGGRPYCEPYCGAASLFWRREPAPVEVPRTEVLWRNPRAQSLAPRAA